MRQAGDGCAAARAQGRARHIACGISLAQRAARRPTMSEGRLQPNRNAHSRERAITGGQLAATSAWNGDARDPATTAYDDLWFLGRPKLP